MRRPAVGRVWLGQETGHSVIRDRQMAYSQK